MSTEKPARDLYPRVQIPVVSSTVGIAICAGAIALGIAMDLTGGGVEVVTLLLLLGIILTIRGNVAERVRGRLLAVCREIITSRPDLTASSTADIAIDSAIQYGMVSPSDARSIVRSRSYYRGAIVRELSGRSARLSQQERESYIDLALQRGSAAILGQDEQDRGSSRYQEKASRIVRLYNELLLLPREGDATTQERRYQYAVSLNHAVGEAHRQRMRE